MSDSTSLSSLSSDEDFLEDVRLPRRMRIIRDRSNPMEIFDDIDFRNRFRFTKNSFMEIIHIIGNRIEPITRRNKSIDAVAQLLIVLRFYATGAFQSCIGDHILVSQPTVCRIVKRITHILAMHRPNYIAMPNREELRSVCEKFYQIAGVPHVIGAVDGVHIRIQCPNRHQAELYRNRKGYYSLNVLIVCDARLKIRCIIARWPGSVHDATVFNDSPLVAEFEQGLYGENFLLGDSGYPCRKYLLTPILNPTTAAEQRYNRAHVRTRNTIERCFGVFKRRFPCMHSGLRNKLENIPGIIVACAVLHNLAISFREQDFPEDGELEEQVEINLGDVHENQNTAIRTALIQQIFYN